ncbi:hypothetical protein BAV1277A [Bordetella avium 197N]|uniref:Uncharacterized protein n=1 Tax=Bordetella avium (strain 197N) TaxID=360910 RepID=Q2L305_BORA1|nr:hypothetical protein BAV1277A [Bordetella avium 197N]
MIEVSPLLGWRRIYGVRQEHGAAQVALAVVAALHWRRALVSRRGTVWFKTPGLQPADARGVTP